MLKLKTTVVRLRRAPMKTSKLQRKWIGALIGFNESSIFVNNVEAFNDRTKLFNVKYNMNKLIEQYNSEMSSFESERDYDEYLKNCIEILRYDIESKINICKNLILSIKLIRFDAYDKRIEQLEKIGQARTGEIETRVYFESPVYEAIKYICNGMFTFPMYLRDYILDATNSKFLSNMLDIGLEGIGVSQDNVKYIQYSMKELSMYMYGLIHKDFKLKRIGNSEITLCRGNNPSVLCSSIIYDILEKAGIQNVDVETYEIKENAGRQIKSSKLNDVYDLVQDNDPLDNIKYLREIRGEQLSKYDGYFNCYGVETYMDIQCSD